MKMKFLSLLALFSIPLGATDSKYEIEHVIRSKHPSEERKITVHLPKSYFEQSKFAYPVLYLLDGHANLGYSEAVAAFLAENAAAPEMIIVGMHSGAERGRDYRPKGPAENGKPAGEADQFLLYIEKELIPFIESNYRSAPLRFLSGHSLGGVFVLHTMTARPDLFRGYFAHSPYLNEAIGDLLLRRTAAFLKEAPKSSRFLYLNLGDEPDLEKNFAELEALLEAASPGTFRVEVVREPSKTHMTTRLVGQYDALERFFAPDWPLSKQKIVAGKAAGVKGHIDGLSAKYGYPILYSEQLLAQATQISFSQRDIASGLAAAQLYREQYPKSPIAHFFLAAGYRASGEREKASQAIETAVKLYESNPRADLKPLYANMKQLKASLAGK